MTTTAPWTKLVSEDSDAGFRAAWLLARNAMSKGHYSRARNLVMGQPRLAHHTLGREIVARLTLLEGDEAGAAQLFAALEPESVEAQMFLAQRAYNNQQWEEARRLNGLLLEQFPDWDAVRRQIRAIDHIIEKADGGAPQSSRGKASHP